MRLPSATPLILCAPCAPQVLVGCITASVFDLIVAMIMPASKASKEVAAPGDVEAKTTDVTVDENGTDAATRARRVRCGVLIGDFMHNLCAL